MNKLIIVLASLYSGLLSAATLTTNIGVSATLTSNMGPAISGVQNLNLGTLSVAGVSGANDACAQNAGGAVICTTTGNATYTTGSGSQLGQVTIENQSNAEVDIASITTSSSTAVANSTNFIMDVANTGVSCLGTLAPNTPCSQNLSGTLRMPANYNFSINPPGALAFPDAIVTITYSG